MKHAAWLLLGAILLTPHATAASITIHAGTRPGGTMYFSPSDIHAREEDKLTLTIINDDPNTPHDWALLTYGDRDIEAYTAGGATKTITFTANEPGTYRTICQIVGHKQAGMEGTLTIENRLLPNTTLPLTLGLLAAVALLARIKR